MGYIIKDTSALLTTKITDAARKKMSEGTFNITYFQVGDSEVCYNCISGEDLTTGMVLESEYNAQSLSPIPEKNKANIKYPLKVTSTNSNTYGIPVKASYIDNIFNTAAPRGFFNTGTTSTYDVIRTGTAYTINPNFIFDITDIDSGNTISLTADVIDSDVSGTTQSGDFAVLYFENTGTTISGDSPVLFYKVVSITGDTSINTGTVTIEVDRQLPQLNSMGYTGNGRVIFYPSGMTELYDSYTPSYYWQSDAIDFESNCDVSDTDVKIWNMNIPWTESPAGVASASYKDYTTYTSKKYIGTKEYLGYNSNTGQTDTSSTYYYNSFAEKINLSPSNQKSIAIVHYTNQAIDNYYGEKFAMQPYDASNPGDTGQARNFKITIPWLMWHKSSDSNIGETFYTDPPGYNSNLGLFDVKYIKSVSNTDMNDPGLRYYHLWDTNTNTNGYPNRVGKVWPDLKLVTFDDDEIISALSYKSNRNWTLPAPKLGLIVPNTCNDTDADDEGLLSGSSQSLWVTYRLNSTAFTESLHCNYYSLISGTDPDCPPDTADVTFRLGDEFPFLKSTITSNVEGFTANEISILAQKVTTGQKPNPTQWREIDVTSQIESTKVNGFLTVSGLTNTTISINKPNYDSASLYNLDNYIEIPGLGATGQTLNFGDEYFFYGEVQSDIQATIYVLNYLCNLGQGQFMTSNNPTWSTSDTPYVSEVGLYDSDKNLMIISKVQSPEQRLGVQQYNIKIDF